MVPWLFKWVASRREVHECAAANRKQNNSIFSHLKETLNPQMCRGFVDAFLVKGQTLEVRVLASNFPMLHCYSNKDGYMFVYRNLGSPTAPSMMKTF